MSGPTIFFGSTSVDAIVAEHKRLSDLAPQADQWFVYVRPEIYAALRHRGKHVKAKLIERFRQTGKRVKR